MAYTAPSAVTTGQSITATLYNTFVKDNILDHESRIVTAGPAGVVSAFAGTAAPTGWLLCDGSQVSQATYAALYAVVGANAFGTDSGGNFFLPDLKGRTVIGVGVGTEITGVRGTLQGAATLPAHTHTFSGTSDYGDFPAYFNHYSPAGGSAAYPVATSEGNGRFIGGAGAGHQHGFSGTTASTGTGSHGVVQPSMPLNYIIKF